MAFSFTRFKDYSAAFFDALANGLARSPNWVQSLVYGILRLIARSLYFLPGSHFRKVATGFSQQAGYSDPRSLYFSLIDGLIRMVRWLELLSRGGSKAQLPSFALAEGAQEALDAQMGKGAILIMPHSTGSLLSVRELASRYDVLMLIKEPKDARRAERQRRFFEHLGCEILDVRRTDPGKVARTIFKALRAGRFVIGTCDRIRSRPKEGMTYDKETDNVLCNILGGEVGVVGWPARFADKCKLPMIPLMPLNLPDRIILNTAAPIAAEGDINIDSQAWMDSLWNLFCEHPEHWMFAYDKKWAKLLK